ncbi:hypothetical protein GM661_11870 [Iocasia frigidifontis]|uniref:Uncharacterized protein n=1 Tax=Iocasia fonsfrigidae TaxID=2682810 RepID=A0A8A7KBJ5_9FIRM|nr:hypothetical protein [Iocasia fonsfrigidae]QTL98610.1 hypothetical protein GM661_11870 [Iocasia fonsfrigidae]
MEVIRKVLKWLEKLIYFIMAVFAVIVYTPEYYSENKIGFLKDLLSREISMSISLLMLLIIVFIFIWILIKVFFRYDTILNNYKKQLCEIENKNNNKKLDEAVFKRLKDVLPYNNVRNFLKDKDLGNKFSRENLEMIYNFLSEKDNPEFKFKNKEIEVLIKKLNKKLTELTSLLGEYASTVGNTEMLRIHRSLKSHDPVLYSKIIREANNTATEAWNNYHKIIDLGRENFGDIN